MFKPTDMMNETALRRKMRWFSCVRGVRLPQGVRRRFTGPKENAYIRLGVSIPMGLPALKAAYENLAAGWPGATRAVSSKCEVINLPHARSMRKDIDEIVTKLALFRRMLISAILATEKGSAGDLSTIDTGPTDLRGLVMIMTEAKRLLDRGTIVDMLCDGTGLGDALEGRDEAAGRTAVERRYARRQARRVKEACDVCEPHRIKLLALLEELIPRLQGLPAHQEIAPPSKQSSEVDFTSIFEASLARYPVITEHLAR